VGERAWYLKRMPSRRVLALCAASILALSALPGTAAGEDLPAPGQVEIKSYAVTGSSTPRIVARGVMDVPAKKVWAIVSDCAHYKEHLPRVAASELLKKEGNVHTCKVTIDMPFPLSNLTGVTSAVHTESDTAMSRKWTLVSGDYTVNEGSWEVKALDGGQSLVVYTIHAEPKTSVPEWIRETAQKKTLPELFERVKAEAGKLP
jgi:ribosome-associated toxin RatA of RatAB toxin-antitoxin module